MKPDGSGNRLAIAVFVCAAIWVVLRASGFLRLSPIQLPIWSGFIVGVGILLGPASAALVQPARWVARLVAFVIFASCVFVFPWFYDQFPVYFWVTIALAYVEVYWVIPWVLRQRRARRES